MKAFNIRNLKADRLRARALRSRSRRADVGALALSGMGVYGVLTDNWRMAGTGLAFGCALMAYSLWLSVRARAILNKWDKELL